MVDGDLDQAAKKRLVHKTSWQSIQEWGHARRNCAVDGGVAPSAVGIFQEFAERNPPEEQPERLPDPDDSTVSEDQLQEMMDRLQQLMEEGRMAEAQELLEEINRLMQNLQTSQSQSGGEGQDGQDGGQQQMEIWLIACVNSSGYQIKLP